MAKTKEELVTMIETELVDPTSNKITGESVKAVLTDIVDAIGTGSALEYWAVPETGAGDELEVVVMVATYVRGEASNGLVIGGAIAAVGVAFGGTLLAFAYDPTLTITMEGDSITAAELLAVEGVDLTALGYTQITKEEFFSTETTTTE